MNKSKNIIMMCLFMENDEGSVIGILIKFDEYISCPA